MLSLRLPVGFHHALTVEVAFSELSTGTHPRTMAQRTGPSAGYYQPRIARGPKVPKATYEVCARVESTLPNCLRAQKFYGPCLLIHVVITRKRSTLAV